MFYLIADSLDALPGTVALPPAETIHMSVHMARLASERLETRVVVVDREGISRFAFRNGQRIIIATPFVDEYTDSD